MKSNQPQLNQLAQERAAIVRSGSLHWVHWMVVSSSLVLTFGAWYFVTQQIEEKTTSQFNRAADQVLELVSERMQKYEDGLWGGVSAIHSQGGDISYEEWQVFADSLRIDIKYPGINGIGVIHHVATDNLEAYLEDQRRSRPGYNIHPEHDKTEFLPITYIEPSAVNAGAVGLDIAHETNRYSAALRARDYGTAQITGPIVLVQDEGRKPGFLFYAPFYSGGTDTSLQDRRNNFVGMVYAPFVFHKLMDGVLGKDKRQVRIRVSDAGAVLYDEQGETEQETTEDSGFTTAVDLDLYGRTWTFDIWATKSFRQGHATDQPLIILLGGIFIDSLLFAIFVLLSRSNRRALSFADRMTHELQVSANSLQKSNVELEKFAYVTSHDLKTPLRGIGDLVEYLEEDLEPYTRDPDANPDVGKNIQRLHQQVDRMNGLIKGILEYSSIGSESERLEEVKVADLVSTLQADIGFRADQVILTGDFPVLITDVVRLQQVFANLMGNAKKYHHDPEHALVTVNAAEAEDFYVFSVADNGPGIDPRFHSRIFEVFQTLQTRDEVESTGIGLSIVKKAVEIHGGTIRVSSELGEGTKFIFEWPKTLELALPERVAA